MEKYYYQGTQVPQIFHKNEVEYLQFPCLKNTGLVRHLFSTRLGGVSKGCLQSMNLSYTRGDDPDCVRENYRRIAEILNCRMEDMVATYQTHTTNVRRVGSADRGNGVTREKSFVDVDGLVTNEKGIVLTAYFADCVPLFLVDPVHQAIGLAHSGWRGTVQRMGLSMVQKMKEEFSTDPKDLVTAIGPSICRSCYEVSEDVAEQFRNEFQQTERTINNTIVIPKENGKYLVDLWAANRQVLLDAGVPMEHIEVTGLCTACNDTLLFSHRKSQGKRGNLGAFLGLL